MIDLSHIIRGNTAAEFVRCIEAAIRAGKLAPGAPLPTVRALARKLEVSPTTVAAAYQRLQLRGLLLAAGRRGTRVSHLPLSGRPPAAGPVLPPGSIDLSDGNPDSALLPDMAPALKRIDASIRLYGGPASDPGLSRTVARDLADDGIQKASIAFLSGAADAIDRVLAIHFRPGDRVAIEDPIYGNILDLALARGLTAIPIEIDPEGARPESVARAIRQGAQALLVTPRAQNPTGAAISRERARDLAAELRRAPDLMLIEDDHLANVCAEPLFPLHHGRNRWAYIRSYSKSLNPDLRIAAVTGDAGTMARIEDRLVLGERWVSHLLQRSTNALLCDRTVRKLLAHAAATYSERRSALVAALAVCGITSRSRSGYNVWIPVAAETPVVQGMAERGWAVRAGERFRIQSPAAVRITAAALKCETAAAVAATLQSLLDARNLAASA